MSHRKGEITSAQIDRQYPHQVIIPARYLTGGDYHFVRYFCDRLSVAPRNHSLVKNDEWQIVFCFGLKSDAETFQRKFGGDVFDPKTRGRGSRWHLLRDAR